MSDFNFDLTPIEQECTIGGKKYVLREPSEGAIVRWQNAQTRQLKLVDGKIKSPGDVADTRPLLISMCLFENMGDGRFEPVSETFVRSLPSRISGPMFKWIKEKGELEESESESKEALQMRIAELQDRLEDKYGEQLKNAPSGTDAT